MKGLGTGHWGDVAEESVCVVETLIAEANKAFPGCWRGKKKKEKKSERVGTMNS